MPRTRLLILQPTPFCNIDCTYCYLADRSDRSRMSESTLRRIAQALSQYDGLSSEITVVWHAGEPLVVGVDFFDKAIHTLHENLPNVRVCHAIQTNGLLLNDQWCDLFKKHDVRIGVSIDGPEFIHDHHRLDRRGRGTHSRVMRGIDILKENDIPFGVIAVVSEFSSNFPNEVWSFFVKNNIYQIGLNVEEIEADNTRSSFGDVDTTTRKYEAFIAKFLKLWESHPHKDRIKIREFEDIIGLITRGFDEVSSAENVPFSILNIDWQGNMSTFSPELLGMKDARLGSFVFGNVHDQGISDIADNPAFQAIAAEIHRGVERCREHCDYFSVCGGGPPVNKLCENGSFDSTETSYCLTRIKRTTNLLLDYLERRYDVGAALNKQ